MLTLFLIVAVVGVIAIMLVYSVCEWLAKRMQKEAEMVESEAQNAESGLDLEKSPHEDWQRNAHAKRQDTTPEINIRD